MANKITEKLFNFAQKVFFEEVGAKFSPGTFRNMMNYLYVIFEKTAYQFDFSSEYYLRFYKELVENEIDLAKIISKDQILVIGCGSIPATSIIIAKKTNAHVTSIDIDPRAIKNASILINKLKLENKMTLEFADGHNYLIKKFDVVFVLYGVKNHGDLLYSVGNEMKDNARIIFRSVLEDNKKILGLNENNKTFDIKKTILSQKIYPTISCLLFKKS